VTPKMILVLLKFDIKYATKSNNFFMECFHFPLWNPLSKISASDSVIASKNVVIFQ
jgi:hypothetical protein